MFIFFQEWIADDKGALRFVFPFEHQYTKTNLRFENLKGSDRTVVDILREIKDPGTKVSYCMFKEASSIERVKQIDHTILTLTIYC